MSSESEPSRKGFLRAFAKATRDSLKETFNAVGGTIEQGAKSPSKKANPVKFEEAKKVTPHSATSTANLPTSSVALRPRNGQTPPNTTPINAWEETGAPKIPSNLTEEEKEVYRSLITVRKTRILGSQGQEVAPPRVIVITDLGKDYDDLAAMVVLKELHRLGLIELEGFIANLHPPQERAKLARGCLDSLGLEDIPVAWGEEAQADATKREPPHYYEFPKNADYFSSIYSKDASFTPYDQEKADPAEIESGVRLLDRLVLSRSEPRPTGQKPRGSMTFLCISGLADIATYAKREPEKLAKVTKNVVLQGDYSIQLGPHSCHAILTPNLTAANNSFDQQAAKEWHEYMDNHQIPSVVYTSTAAANARLAPTVFDEMRDTMHPIGQHLRTIQRIQDLHYYKTACNKDPTKRFLPRCDQGWFLRTKTNWEQAYPDKETRPKPPVGEEVLNYVQLVCYDAVAALGTAGNDVLDALDLLKPKELFENLGPDIHMVVGVPAAKEGDVVKKPERPGVNSENMQLALTALLKGSLMAVQEGIPSSHTSGRMWTDANTLAASAAIGTGAA